MEEDKLQELIDLVTDMDKKLDIHIATSAATSKIAQENQHILKGEGKDTGLVAQVERNTDDIKDAKRVIDKVLAPILYAIGIGVIYLIIAGASGFGR